MAIVVGLAVSGIAMLAFLKFMDIQNQHMASAKQGMQILEIERLVNLIIRDPATAHCVLLAQSGSQRSFSRGTISLYRIIYDDLKTQVVNPDGLTCGTTGGALLSVGQILSGVLIESIEIKDFSELTTPQVSSGTIVVGATLQVTASKTGAAAVGMIRNEVKFPLFFVADVNMAGAIPAPVPPPPGAACCRPRPRR